MFISLIWHMWATYVAFFKVYGKCAYGNNICMSDFKRKKISMRGPFSKNMRPLWFFHETKLIYLNYERMVSMIIVTEWLLFRVVLLCFVCCSLYAATTLGGILMYPCPSILLVSRACNLKRRSVRAMKSYIHVYLLTLACERVHVGNWSPLNLMSKRSILCQAFICGASVNDFLLHPLLAV